MAAPGTPLSSPTGPYAGDYGLRPRRRRWGWAVAVIAAVLIGLALLLVVVALNPGWFGLSGPSGFRYGLFGGFFLVFFVLIVVFFVLRVAFWSMRAGGYSRRGGRGAYGGNRPAMIARMRYARGEITQQQYYQILQDLGRRPPPP